MNIIMLFIVMIFFVVVIAKQPAIAISIFCISLTYEVSVVKIQALDIYLFDVFYFILIFKSLMIKKKHKNKNPKLFKVSNLNLVICTFIYWSVFSTLVSFYFIDNTSIALSNVVSLLRYIQIISVYFIIMKYNLENNEIIRVFKVMYLNAIIIAIYGIYQTLLMKSMPYHLIDWWGRTYSVFDSAGPNAFAVYIILFIGIPFRFIMDKSVDKKNKIISIIALILLVYPFIFSISRTGYVAFLVMALYMVYRTNRIHLITFTITMLGIIFTNGFIYNRLIAFTFSSTGLDSSSIGRLEYWKAAFATILNYPILGVGFNGFSVIGLNYTTYFTHLIDVHNDFIQVTLNSGFVGLLLYIGIFYQIVFLLTMNKKYGSRSQKRSIDIYLASLIGLLVASIFSTPFLNYQVIGQFWAGTALLLSFKEDNSHSEKVNLE